MRLVIMALCFRIRVPQISCQSYWLLIAQTDPGCSELPRLTFLESSGSLCKQQIKIMSTQGLGTAWGSDLSLSRLGYRLLNLSLPLVLLLDMGLLGVQIKEL